MPDAIKKNTKAGKTNGLDINQNALPISANTFAGGILQSSSGQLIYLRQYHSFGRMQGCHTLLSREDISRIHALICWKNDRWHLEDKSTNGVWINDQKVAKDTPIELHINDKIILSSRDGESFKVLSLLPPCDLLIHINPSKPAIPLNKPQTDINENISMTYGSLGWKFIDRSKGGQPFPIQNGELLQCGGAYYRLQTNIIEHDTLINRPTAHSASDLDFKLEVSDDEEHIKLIIQDAHQTTEVAGHRIQSQLYLLLCLARKSIADKEAGYSDNNRGWIALRQLSKTLGIEPENTRIRLHRLRTRLRDSVSFSGFDACELLQLKDGEIRFNSENITVIKGNDSENRKEHH
ncbi:FHA domain-containing protein [Marinomonas mediterranea]|jgi:FOG: FHA domain|uniref:Forkhead-associated protein n=1 Tax=Marinomonas mediterranea (strain ATCC 700492 / JCM 21426 / NBRC 103028 / MMB-1) TaxID=717774 RepID=F2JU58_MARM1|nr:FHA domain-containing protein [Marinomonas mediterranea]ADZ91570.1 Forkhead-associated protein [Marinomonas mediterranea MMB-1]WCN09532.1 FHA domain-containing protein [Marinomonas mediterranea]WCN13608.1 FHA domain-containing protein [Marinomonas mediterranea]WCN17674.1 FHA domain-containing protein [Marinomonas mediterranea MMB-1]